jgi:hypothetical protein
MPVINLCGYVGANSGQIACDTKRGVAKMLIIGGYEFTEADFATPAAFEAALIAQTKLETGNSEKLYPFPEIQGATDNTEADKEGATGYGTKRKLSEGRPAYTFDIETGTVTEKKLRRFNKAVVPVFILDDNGNVWGRLNADGKFVGVDAEIFVSGTRYSDGNNINMAKVSVNFQSASDFYDDAAYVETSLSPSDVEGLLDATLETLAAPTGNAHKIGVKIVNASLGQDVNLYDQYSTDLADTALWTGTKADGTVLVPTSVVVDAALEGWTVTFAAAVVSINLEDPATLDANDVTGIEGVRLAV